ncbi:MAG: hypothetical protein AMXMBFR82_24630 [Candidatus Hydrogenedentota bacterium]
MQKPAPNRPTPKPFIGIHFECCGVYARIYLNKKGDAYAGHCPKCAAPIRVKAAPGGSKNRFWSAR